MTPEGHDHHYPLTTLNGAGQSPPRPPKGPGAAAAPAPADWLWVATALLTGASFWVVCTGAYDEPYFGDVRPFDAVTQVGVGFTLLALWVAASLAAAWWVCRRRVGRAALLIVPWGLVCSFYLWRGARGYLSDVARYRAGELSLPGTAAPPAATPATRGGPSTAEPTGAAR